MAGGHVLKGNNVVAGLHVCDALTDGLDDTSTLVSEDDGEGTLGVLAGQCVGVCVADTGVVDLNADLVGPGGPNLDILNGEVLAGFPGNGGLLQSAQMLGPLAFSIRPCPRLSAAQCLSLDCGSASAKREMRSQNADKKAQREDLQRS